MLFEMLNYLIKFSLLCSSFGSAADNDGWVTIVPVTKKTFHEAQTEADNLSIWTLFTKQIGEELIKVRIPGEPKYHYVSQDEIEITSILGEEMYRLNVLHEVTTENVEQQIKEIFLQPEIALTEINRVDQNRWDIHYRLDGKWIAKTYVLKKKHLCIFHSENPISNRQNQEDFVASLKIKIEKNRKRFAEKSDHSVCWLVFFCGKSGRMKRTA
jgi:hypothetical protein